MLSGLNVRNTQKTFNCLEVVMKLYSSQKSFVDHEFLDAVIRWKGPAPYGLHEKELPLPGKVGHGFHLLVVQAERLLA